MSLSIYEASVPTMLRTLTNLSGILEKGRVFADAEKIDAAVLLGSRLAPNMFALTRQVQIVSDTVKGAAARFAQVEAPKFADTEASFAELAERIQRTQDYLKSFQSAQFDGADIRPIVIKFPNRSMNFKTGWEYLYTFVLPNAYFHTTTAYAILRHNGVKLGKSDYLGAVGEG